MLRLCSYKPLQGLVFPPSDPQPLVSNQPKQELELEYVHGYQGQGTRHNIFLIGSGEIAYFVGRLGEDERWKQGPALGLLIFLRAFCRDCALSGA